MNAPATLDHAGIASRIPHAGTMCLLDQLLFWSADEVRCAAISHTDPANPLRTGSGLLAPAAIEYASQAMALHGALAATEQAPRPGFLAAARRVRLHVARLDDIAGAIVVVASRTTGGARQASYQFAIEDERGRLLVDGRATVVLNTPLPTP
jgi:predicted hotdog family 3-hydroxylacyl-ACP dehydratase